jgi:hypothetical protein
MVHSLRRYYPDEMEVLRWLSMGETDVVRDLVRQKPSLLNHLVGYGVVRASDLTITIPTFDRWLFMQQGRGCPGRCGISVAVRVDGYAVRSVSASSVGIGLGW